jgi:hypothetical protein
MFTLGGTYNEIVAFIRGYSSASNSPLSERDFDRFVCLKNSFPTNYVWDYVIKECSRNEKEAISNLKDTILEFIELKKTLSEEEIMRFAIESSNSEETEAERVFRKFDNALLTGNKEIIQSLIIENEQAEILWSGSYPEDVASILIEASESQPLKSIPLSENGNKVKIIAPGWPFPIFMKLNEDKWLIEADKIIALRMSNKKLS